MANDVQVQPGAITGDIPAVKTETAGKRESMRSVYRAAWIFAAPGIIVFILFAWYPLIMGFVSAFQSYEAVNYAPFVGWENFKAILSDSITYVTFRNTLEYTILSIVLTFLVPIIVAILLMEMSPRIIRIMMILWYIPVSSLAGMIIWKWIYNKDYGLLNAILAALGLPQLGWLNDPRLTMIALILPGLIMYGPGLIYVASLQSIPSSLYEAADLEGASVWQKMRYITLPRLRPIIAMTLVLSTIGNMSVFENVLVMTGGGPANRTRTVVMYIYQLAFEYWQYGRATALAIMLFLVIGILILLQRRYFRENIDV